MIRALLLLALAAAPAAAEEALPAVPEGPLTTTLSTQGGGGPAIGFTLRGGVATAPSYFGSSSNEAGPDLGFALNFLRLGPVRFGDPDPLFVPEGFGITGSFRYIGERDDDDDGELAGLDDVDAALELGLGLRYATPAYQVFAAARYGVVGHHAWVGEVGADAFLRPSDRLTLRLGPRALFGSDSYADTYFGVSADEAAASAFTEYDPSGGLVSTGVELGAGYRLSENWGIDAAVRYDKLRRDAKDSPISDNDDQLSARIGVTRRFTLGF